MSADAAPERRYDKGERRYKHVAKGAAPTIEFDDHDPKRWIGKCPSDLSELQRSALLREAIAVPNGGRDLQAPKKLYVVHEGAIYEAQTSDRGRSYHDTPIGENSLARSWGNFPAWRPKGNVRISSIPGSSYTSSDMAPADE